MSLREWPATVTGVSGTDYIIEQEIGGGGTSRVALARHEATHYAIKALSDHRFPLSSIDARFYREARILSELDHPNVIAVLDRIDEPSPMIVLEYLEKGSLHQHLLDSGPVLYPERQFALVRDLLTGLAELDRRGIVHRDLSPKNVLLRDDGTWLIADFGTARVEDDTTITLAEEHMGAVVYIAPEQFASAHAADIRADLYAVGQIAFRAFSGLSPQGNTGSIVDHAPQLPIELAACVEHLRKYHRDLRPANATAALEELSDAESGYRARTRPLGTLVDAIVATGRTLDELASTPGPLRGDWLLSLPLESAICRALQIANEAKGSERPIELVLTSPLSVEVSVEEVGATIHYEILAGGQDFFRTLAAHEAAVRIGAVQIAPSHLRHHWDNEYAQDYVDVIENGALVDDRFLT